jgi:SRSO17 transposase
VNWEADLQGWLAPFLAALPRAEPRRWAPVYLEGLLSPAERKSVEPMAAHVCPGEVQQLHHFVSAAPWAPAPLEAVLARVADRLVGGPDAVLIIDDTALPKQGTHSVGVARQYCGALGKTANCQVLVSLTLARGEVPVPVALQLYLPQAWADDPARRAGAKVPEHVRFQTKGALALAEVDRLRATGVRFGAVAADAGYGTSAAFRAALTRRGLLWAVGVLGTQRVYPTTVTLRPPRRRRGPRGGRPRRHPVPSAPAVAAAALIDGLSPPAFRRVRWRQGTKGPLVAEVAVVRVRVADGPTITAGVHLPGEEAWLVCERRAGGERKYYLANLPATTSRAALVRLLKARWVCEQGHQQMKEELGLDHYEGRSWGGLHHHALLTQIAFAFLQHRRLRIVRRAARRGKKIRLAQRGATTRTVPPRRASRPAGNAQDRGVSPLSRPPCRAA